MANSDKATRKGQRVSTADQLLRTLAGRRRAKGLSQAQLADRLGIAQAHVSDIERGTRKLSVPRLLEMANILDLDLVVQERGGAGTKQEW